MSDNARLQEDYLPAEPEPELPWTPAAPGTEVAIRDPQDTPLDEAALTPRGVNWYARAFTTSGMFPGQMDQAKAVVKILAGRELGVGPFEAMRSIHIINGSAALAANAVAARVKRSGRYNFKPLKTEPEVCEIEWRERDPQTGEWEVMGTSKFTRADAERANLWGKGGWRTYPTDLCFARALTAGARRYAPDCFGMGAIYTPEELGAGATDEADGTLAIGVEGGAG